MKNEQKTYLMWGILLILIAVLSFWGGAMVQSHRMNRFFMMKPGMHMMYRRIPGRFGATFGMNGSVLSGQIANISGNQITMKLANGTTITITLSSTTKYAQATTANQSSLKQGESITISEQRFANGFTSAKMITIQQ